ncbi:acyltransferase family protein [Leifsonia poae]|uniref:acyltransferase family protein n=1 Tax=Leifsonia poae TaxID=110933 RepID=UPI003D6920BE
MGAIASQSAAAPARNATRTVARRPREKGASAHYPAVDGLRGIAILSIAVFHTGLYENGILGVDAFLVLSGFFVTLTLGRGYLRRGTLGLRGFYGRRIKRLLPALLLVLGLTAVAVWIWGTPRERGELLPRGLSAILNVANWQAIAQGDAYWSTMGQPGPLSHLWSLSLTEQFYLIWPPLIALIVFIARKAGAIRRTTALVAIGVISLAVFLELSVWNGLVFAAEGADRAYMGTDTHGLALAAGSVAGIVVLLAEARGRQRSGRRLSPAVTAALGAVALVSLVTLSVCADSYRAEWLYYGGFAAAAALVAALAVLLTKPSPLSAALSVAPLAAIGRMSYAIFVVHMPVIWLTRTLLYTTSDLLVLAVSLPVTLIIAAVVHYTFSEPLRTRSWRASGRVVAGLMTAVTAAVVAIVAVLPTGTAGSPRVVTLGDSLANDFASALEMTSSDFSVIDGGLGGCGIMSPEATRTHADEKLDVPVGCLPWENRYAQLLQQHKPDVVVIDLAWDGVEQRIDGKWADLTSPAMQDRYRTQLDTLGTVLEASPAQVLIADSRAETGVTNPGSSAVHSRLVAEFAQKHDTVTLLELNARMCPKGECRSTTAGGAERYLDGVHFTRAGLAELGPWLASAVTRVSS